MPHPNGLAGTCYLCARYVGIGKGQLLKNSTPNGNQLVANGHRYVVRCAQCAAAPAVPTTTRPTEDTMTPATVSLFRSSLRKELLRLLCDPDLPPEKVRPGQAWLEVPGRPLSELQDLKDKLIRLRNERRERRQLAA